MNVCRCLKYLRLELSGINFWQAGTEVQIFLPKRNTVPGSVSILRLNKYIGTCVCTLHVMLSSPAPAVLHDVFAKHFEHSKKFQQLHVALVHWTGLTSRKAALPYLFCLC